MAVEQCPHMWEEIPKQRHSSNQLIDKECRWVQDFQFAGEPYQKDKMILAKNGAEDGKAGEDGWRNDGVAANSDIE